MDYSLISVAATAITTAKELGKAAMGLRDFNQFAVAMSQINEQLLKAQDSLFTHNSQLSELQGQYFEATEKLRKLEEAIRERGRYSLFEICSGNFVYRVNVTPETSNMGNPSTAEPLHYLCQPCFDKGVKAVLGKTRFMSGPDCQLCPSCDRKIFTGYGSTSGTSGNLVGR
jgi:hypothetical protein